MTRDLDQLDSRRSSTRLHGVLVTYRRPADLRRTLESLSQQTRPLDRLLVVDNDPDGSASAVLAGPGYLTTGRNLGPAGGLALGVAVVLADAAPDDWIVFLDDDDPPELATDFERLLSMAVTAEPNVAGVGKVGARYDRRSGRTVRVPDAELVGLVDVDWIGGGQLPLYRAEALGSVDLDGDLFFGFDDLDLGLRLKASGWSLLVDGGRWLMERDAMGRVGVSAKTLRAKSPAAPWRTYYSNRNLLIVAKRWGRWSAPLFATGFALARSARAFRTGFAAGALAWRGIVDGLLGRSGKRADPGY